MGGGGRKGEGGERGRGEKGGGGRKGEGGLVYHNYVLISEDSPWVNLHTLC